jgi:membrane protease YdiL (CAAX protease family)
MLIAHSVRLYIHEVCFRLRLGYMKKSKLTEAPFSIRYSAFLCLLYSLFIPIIVAAPLVIATKLGLPLAQRIGLDKTNVYLLLIFINLIAAIVLFWLISRQLKVSKSSWALLGIRKFKFWKSLKYIAGWPLIIIGGLSLVAVISNLLGYQPPAKGVENDPVVLKHQLLAVFIAVSLIAPLLEEVLYRGILFPSIARKYGTYWGVALSSIFFAVSHINPIQMVTTIILAPYLCLMYKRLNSIIPGMVLHSLHNAAVTAITIASLQG